MRALLLSVLTSITLLPCSVSAATVSSSSATASRDYSGTMLEGKIAHVKIRKLTKDVAKDIRSAIDSLAQKKPVGMIVDLRGNAGGTLDAVDSVVNAFIPTGIPYMRVHTIYGTLRTTKDGYVYRPSLPLVVLMDGKTNNEAMILAYILKTLRKATVVAEVSSLNANVSDYPLSSRIREYSPMLESSFAVIPNIRAVRSRSRYSAITRDDGLNRAAEAAQDIAFNRVYQR